MAEKNEATLPARFVDFVQREVQTSVASYFAPVLAAVGHVSRSVRQAESTDLAIRQPQEPAERK